MKASDYDLVSGKLFGVHSAGSWDDILLQAFPDRGLIEGEFDSRTHYIDLTDPDNPTPTERPASPVSRTDLTLLDVPTGSTLYINGVSYPAEGTVELDFTYPGTYALRVECFPYLEYTDVVTV